MDLRRAGIVDTKVLSAMEKVPREIFVQDSFVDRAYDNTALPIESGQTISEPYVVAYMTEALKPDPHRRVLEIGTGSGYQTAVLSYLCRRVYTIERHQPLFELAEQRFEQLRITNITTRFGDGFLGWPEAAPFERILVTAAFGDIPHTLVDQLSEDGGILVTPVGRPGGQEVLRITKNAGTIETEPLLPVRFVPMVKGTDRS